MDETKIVQIITLLFFVKCLVGFGTALDGFILFFLLALNVVLDVANRFVKAKADTEALKSEMNERFEKLESTTSKLSITQGFKRGIGQ